MHSRPFIGAAPARQTTPSERPFAFSEVVHQNNSIEEDPTGTGPRDGSNGHPERHRANGRTAVDPSLPTHPGSAVGALMGANSTVDSIDSYRTTAVGGGAGTCRRGDRRRRRRGCQRRGTCVGWAVGGPPGCSPGSSGTCRFDSCPAHCSRGAVGVPASLSARRSPVRVRSGARMN